jgi:hypothetical protein
MGLATHKAPSKGFRGNRYISSSLPKLFLAQPQIPPQELTARGVNHRVKDFVPWFASPPRKGLEKTPHWLTLERIPDS